MLKFDWHEWIIVFIIFSALGYFIGHVFLSVAS